MELQTRSWLSRFITNIDKSYVLCGNDNENQDHVFAKGNFATNVWKPIPNVDMANLHTSSFNLSSSLDSLPYDESENLSLLSKVLLICWQIWNDKNNVIFRKTKPHPTKVPLLAVAVGMDFFRKNSVAGFEVRDENGCPLVVGARSLGICTITVAEAFALRDALRFAQQKGFTKILVKDSKLVIDAIEERCNKHVYREANFVANAVTTLGLTLSNMFIWDRELSDKASTALLFDYNGYGCSRGFSI
ncbi:unnamed protein product [Malus baccata var. baccata]